MSSFPEPSLQFWEGCSSRVSDKVGAKMVMRAGFAEIFVVANLPMFQQSTTVPRHSVGDVGTGCQPVSIFAFVEDAALGFASIGGLAAQFDATADIEVDRSLARARLVARLE